MFNLRSLLGALVYFTAHIVSATVADDGSDGLVGADRSLLSRRLTKKICRRAERERDGDLRRLCRKAGLSPKEIEGQKRRDRRHKKSRRSLLSKRRRCGKREVSRRCCRRAERLRLGDLRRLCRKAGLSPDEIAGRRRRKNRNLLSKRRRCGKRTVSRRCCRRAERLRLGDLRRLCRKAGLSPAEIEGRRRRKNRNLLSRGKRCGNRINKRCCRRAERLRLGDIRRKCRKAGLSPKEIEGQKRRDDRD